MIRILPGTISRNVIRSMSKQRYIQSVNANSKHDFYSGLKFDDKWARHTLRRRNDVKEEEPKPVRELKKTKRVLRPRKALITLSANARKHLQQLLDQPEPKLIRIGVRNRGCSGLTYNLEYVDKPGKFDEIVEQDGIKVVIDSKALFSIVGSEMDWLDDKLSSKFVFRNPNAKGTCGCGESFMV